MALFDAPMKTLMLDMGGVLFKWQKGAKAKGIQNLVDLRLMDHMLQDMIWNHYETDQISGDKPYELLSEKYSIPMQNIKLAIRTGLEAFAPVPEMINLVNEYHGKVRLICVTNVPKVEFDYTYKKYQEIWDKFEKIFTSADAGLRKPDMRFFRYVLQEAQADPKDTIFVDDTSQNCTAAQTLGMTTVVVSNIEAAVQQIVIHLRGAEERLACGRKYFDRVLESGREHLQTVSDKEARMWDNFSEFYIADILDDERFLPPISIPENLELCYTRDTDVRKWTLYPLTNDLDTTAVGMSVWYKYNKVSPEYLNKVVDHMLDFVSDDGLLQTFFDKSRPRLCHNVLANIALLFHIAGRRLPPASEEYLYNVLVNRAYTEGSQFYIGPTPFLFFLSRIAAQFKDDHFLHKDFVPLLIARVKELCGAQTECLPLALLVLSCVNLQIEPDTRDVTKLIPFQKVDGSFDMCYWVKSSALKFGSKALTSAFALGALERARNFQKVQTGVQKR